MSLLAQKYAILARDAETRRIEAQDLGQLRRAQANATPVDSAASAAAAYANAYRNTQEGGQAAGLAKSDIDYRGALTKRESSPFAPVSSDARVNHYRSLGHFDDPHSVLDNGQQGDISAPAPALTIAPEQPTGAGDDPSYARRPRPAVTFSEPAYSHGTSHVPGHGDGTVDTVPAMLAPGEAVLNKGAAEHMGRGMIAALNKLGLSKMANGAPTPAKGMCKGGMASYALGIDEVPATAAIQGTQATRGGIKPLQHHAKGTSNVEGSAQPNPTTGDATSPQDRASALAADPISKNDLIAIHHPSMMLGIQMAAMAKGMSKARSKAA